MNKIFKILKDLFNRKCPTCHSLFSKKCPMCHSIKLENVRLVKDSGEYVYYMCSDCFNIF